MDTKITTAASQSDAVNKVETTLHKYFTQGLELNLDDFKRRLLEPKILDLCRSTIFDRGNWYFEESGQIKYEDGYQKFKQAVASQLEIPNESVHLVGSSRYGFSLSPSKNKTFREFNDESDLDTTIISQSIFEEVWSGLMSAYYGGYDWMKKCHQGDIFKKYILLRPGTNYRTAYLRGTQKKLNGIRKQVYLATGCDRQVKYRIYADEEAAIQYHLSGLEVIKKRLQEYAQ